MSEYMTESEAKIYSNTVIGTLAVVDGWAVTFGTSRTDHIAVIRMTFCISDKRHIDFAFVDNKCVIETHTEFIAHSKYQIQGLSRTYVHWRFSSTKIINEKTYPTFGASKFRLQCDTEACSPIL